MTAKTRRARYSVLFWPSLYPNSGFVIVFAALLLLAAMVTGLQYLSGTNERMLVTRASERARAAATLKLSGAELWQWRNDFACRNRSRDCLPMRWSFAAPPGDNALMLELSAENACAICHAAKLTAGRHYYVSFPGEKIPFSVAMTPWWNFSGAALLGILASLLIFWRKWQRLRKGVVVAALEGEAASRLLPGRRAAYYRETGGNRVRWAAAAEDFADWLRENSALLSSYRAVLRLVAVHVNLRQQSPLAIETMRGVYRLLAQTPQGQLLVEEPLIAGLGEKTINMRRLVFKSKSGASLKFISWEPL